MKLRATRPSIVKLLYQLMYDVHQILESKKIEYFVDGGTFLGCIRHKGLIPWDDDLDICCWLRDKKKIEALIPILEKCGYALVKTWFGYKIFYKNRAYIDGTNYSFPNLDILLYKKIENKYTLAYAEARNIWPKEWFTHKQLYPLKKYKFGEFSVWGPQNHTIYFERTYGSDWNNVAYREYDHEKEDHVKKVKVKLQNTDRVPAKPTEVKERHCVSKLKSKSGKCAGGFDFNLGVYFINCDTHVQRLRKFKEAAKRAGLHSCRQACVNGKKFTNSRLCKMIRNGKLSKNAEMTPIEVAINLSFYKVWKSIVDSGYEYSIILEDDSQVRSNFIENINEILYSLKNIKFDVLYLHNGNFARTKTQQKKVLTTPNGIEIFRETKGHNAGGPAYLITREFAKFMMDKTFPIKMPHDMLMGYTPKKRFLTVKMKYDKKKQCWVSPLIRPLCGGKYGTGADTTQNYEAGLIKNLNCKLV